MSPWQAVDLSEDADIEVVDLTAAEYTKGTKMGKTTTKGRRSQPQIDLSAMDDDEFKDLLIDLAAGITERGIDIEDLEDLDDEPDDDEGDDEGDEGTQARTRKSKVKTTKTVERESDADDDGNPDDDPDADLSDRVIRREEVSQFGQMRIDLARRDWKQTRKDYLAKGVPPVLLDLAGPVLSQPDEMVLDLSDDDGKAKQVDFRETLTEILDNVAGLVDLSDERGSALDIDLSDEEKSATDSLLDVWDKEYSA
jgi:hypothetical protein